MDTFNQRRLNRLNKRRNIRRLRIILTRLKMIARLASYVLIIWGFLKLINLSFWHLNPEIFASYPNPHLQIGGNNIVTTQQIVNKLKKIKLPNKPLYLIDTKQIEEELNKMAPVKRAIIRRYWLPARLTIITTERRPVLSIAPTQKADPIAVFTRDKKSVRILGRKYLPLPEGMPTYRVITYDNYRAWKPSLIQYIEELAEQLERDTNSGLVYLDIRNPNDTYAQMEHVRLRLGGLKGRETFKRVEKVRSVIPKAMEIKDTINYIDLRWKDVSIKLKKKDQKNN